jgi:hypothetical protein
VKAWLKRLNAIKVSFAPKIPKIRFDFGDLKGGFVSKLALFRFFMSSDLFVHVSKLQQCQPAII